MGRVHGVYRGRGDKYVRLRSPSPNRRVGPRPSGRVPRTAPGRSRAAPPRFRAPEATRAPPVPLMELQFPNLGRSGPAPRTTGSPARPSPTRPLSRNIMGVQALPSLAGWRPQMPGIHPAYRLGAPVRGPVASPPLDPCPDDVPPWAHEEPHEPLTQRTLDLVRPYWLAGSAAHYAVIRELRAVYAASMRATLDELLNLLSTLMDVG